MIDWRRLLADRRAMALIGGIPVLVVALVGFILIADPFASEPLPSPVAGASPTASPSPTPSPMPTATPPPATPTPTPMPTPTPRPAALRDGRLTVLFLGSDSSAGRRHRTHKYLTDAITVVSVTENGRRLALISLPRDTAEVPMADGSIWVGKINTMSLFRGPATVRDTMEVLLGIRIDHYVQLDMDDFRAIVRRVDGVRVKVPYPLFDERCAIAAGVQMMHAERALCYARHRYSDNDYARGRRHQQLLLELRDKMLRSEINYHDMFRSFGSLRTDVRPADLSAFADLLQRTRHARVARLLLAPPTYTTFAGVAGSRGWISIPNVPVIQQAVAAALRR